ncbi:putative ABC transporter ATP-binding protein YxlF [compost metagenome]
MIRIEQLVKTYGSVEAVRGLDLEARPGEVLALLGPNGAGKSTTMKTLVGLVPPTRGRVLIDGIDVVKFPREARKLIGYLPQRVAFYENLTAREVLAFFAKLRGADLKRNASLLERVGLGYAADRKTLGFSGGMLQRLGLAVALLGDPRLLILDEPTVGLDPEGSMLFKEIIREQHQAGTTVLLSSHLLGEIQSLCDRIAICLQGRIATVDTLEGLRAERALRTRMVLKLGNTNGHTEALALAAGVDEARFHEGVLRVSLDGASKATLIRTLEEDGITIHDLRTEEPSLEDIFLAYVQSDRKESHK